MKKRVVITGMGAITPVGNSVTEFWDSIRAGRVGIGPITKFDTTDYKVKIAAEVKDFNAKDRLQNITGKYRENIFNQAGGEYWKDLYCWPTKIVEYNGKLGLTCPTYQKQFFFHFFLMRYWKIHQD